MEDPELQAATAAAAAYEELFVPALFAEWAPRVASAARLGRGQRVLDVACGTGVLAREAARRVGPEGEVVGLDASPGMLAVAARVAPELEWRAGQAGELPFGPAAFDAVLSQFGLMFFPDRVCALREMLRVLAPGGRLAVAVWDRVETSPGYVVEIELLERLGGKRAADALRAPFVLGDAAELEALFRAAGAASIELSSERGTARFPSIRAMVEADLRGWLPLMNAALDEATIQRILAEAERALSPYRDSSGHVVFAAPAHIVSAVRG